MRKVFSWRKYVRAVAGDFNKVSDFLNHLDIVAEDLKHLVKKDSDYVADYNNGEFYNEDFFNEVEDVVVETKATTDSTVDTYDKNEKLKNILDMLKDLI